MKKTLRNVGDVAAAFGGTAELGRWAGVGQNAVCNWLRRGGIPPSYHVRLLIEARKRDWKIDPAGIFELEASDALLLSEAYREHVVQAKTA